MIEYCFKLYCRVFSYKTFIILIFSYLVSATIPVTGWKQVEDGKIILKQSMKGKNNDISH